MEPSQPLVILNTWMAGIVRQIFGERFVVARKGSKVRLVDLTYEVLQQLKA